MIGWSKIKNNIIKNKTINSVFNEFIYGGHLISIGLCGVASLPAILLDIDITIDFLIVIYLLSLGPCLFGRYVDLKKDALTNPERSVHLSKRASLLPYMIVACVVVAVYILVSNSKLSVIALGIGMIMFSFLYDLYLKKLTKKIIGFKNIFVGILFSLLPVMMMLYYGAEFNLAFWLVVSHIFLLTFIGSAYSDIKDIESDKKDGLKTFAIVFGHKKFIIFLLPLSFLAISPMVVGAIVGVLPLYAMMSVATLFYVLYLFKKSFDTNISQDYLYAVLCDAQLFLWFLFIYIGKVVYLWV